jgi:hypothetical protein
MSSKTTSTSCFQASSEELCTSIRTPTRVVLNDAYRQGTIKVTASVRRLLISTVSASIRPRPWLNHSEYKTLLAGRPTHKHLVARRNLRWVGSAEELYDYVTSGTNTGLRVSECDIGCSVDVISETWKIQREQSTVREGQTTREFLIAFATSRVNEGTGTCKIILRGGNCI